MTIDNCNTNELKNLKLKLAHAINNKRSKKWCLTLWSRFIRARDFYRCVSCGATHQIQAHHIFRKVTYPHGWLNTGNGISLCHACHRIPHAIFNGRPDLTEPINAKGGDDQDEIAYMYGCLLDDAIQRDLDHNEFYYISDEMLLFFVAVQGYEELYYSVQAGNISRLRMTHEIWRVMPELWYSDVYRQLIVLNLN